MEKKNKKTKTEEVATINELAIIMRDAFQTNQEYMDKNFQQISENFKQVDVNFQEIKEKIDNLSKNTVDVVHQEEFDKLETRVTDVEAVLDLGVT